MVKDYSGAIDAAMQGYNFAEHVANAPKRQELQQLQLETARQNISLNQQKLKRAGIEQDALYFENYLKSSAGFKQGDTVDPKFIQSAQNLGINLQALTGQRYNQHRSTLNGLMNGEFERNSPQVMAYMNDLVKPMLNRRPDQDPNLELVEINNLTPDDNGNLMIGGRWQNRQTGAVHDAPVTIAGSADNGASVRGFNVRDLLNWTRNVDGISQAINSNPELAKQVQQMRSTFFPGKGRYSGIKNHPRIGDYQLGPQGEVKPLSAAKGSGLSGGDKAKNRLSRDKAIAQQLTDMMPEGADQTVLANMIDHTQRMDRNTGGKYGIGEVVNRAMQATNGIPLSPQQAIQKATEEAQQMLQQDGDAFDGDYSWWQDEGKRNEWISNRAQQLMKEASPLMAQKLSAISGGGIPKSHSMEQLQQLEPGISMDDAKKVLAEVQHLQSAEGGGIKKPTPSSGITEAHGSTPNSPVEALAAVASSDPSLSQEEAEAKAAKKYPDLFLSGTGIRKVSETAGNELLGYFSKPKDGQRGLRGAPPSTGNADLKVSLLKQIDSATAAAKSQMDKARNKSGYKPGRSTDVPESYAKARAKFEALKKYRKAINLRQKPPRELTKQVQQYLTGQARKQANALLKQSGVEI